MYPDFAHQLLQDADLVFCLDFNALYRVDRMRDELAASPAKKVMIDHHEGPEPFTDVTISHPEQSSTSVLVFRLLCREVFQDARLVLRSSVIIRVWWISGYSVGHTYDFAPDGIQALVDAFISTVNLIDILNLALCPLRSWAAAISA